VLCDSGWSNLEVVVVDNASSDETHEWLDELEKSEPRARIVRNAENRGFAAGCNQGLALARGEYLVILNNDTAVGPGWLRTLVNHVRRDPGIGLIGPVTNNIGNEARIPTRYASMEEMRKEVRTIVAANAGKSMEIPVLAFFCVLMPRAVWDEIGPLDEQFGLGFFEDDDYCQRVLESGRRIVCAEDSFVHHELSASFKQIDEERRRALFEKNKLYYESKWGVWIPHRYRPKEAAAKPTTGARA
jgi:GT2 family glycosyltransferase